MRRTQNLEGRRRRQFTVQINHIVAANPGAVAARQSGETAPAVQVAVRKCTGSVKELRRSMAAKRPLRFREKEFENERRWIQLDTRIRWLRTEASGNSAAACARDQRAYFLRNLSTRPPVSMVFCLPV
jgi:hypothetical protein